MYTLSIVFQTLAVLLLIPFTVAAPAPDTIFLLQKSTFTPLGCSRSFHPTSILRQVPSPFACFSRCSDREIAAYSQLQSGVLCACGNEDMVAGIGEQMERCRDDTWFLFSNGELEKTTSVEATSDSDVPGVQAAAVKTVEKRERLMPFRMMRKRNADKAAGSGQVI